MPLMSSVGSRIFRGAAIVSAFTLSGKLLGFVQKQILAYCFGTGIDADAYVLALQSIGLAFAAIPQKAIAPFLPLFVEKLERNGESAAWTFARSVGILFAGTLAVMFLAGMVGASGLVRLVTVFEDQSAVPLTLSLVRIILPASFLIGLAAFAFLILNSYKRFAIPAGGDALNRALVIVVMLLLYRQLGIKAAAIGVGVGALACLLLQIGALWPKLRRLPSAVDFRDPSIKRLAWLIPPVLIGAGLAQIRTILDFRFASAMGHGFMSSLSYAKVVPDTLTLLVPYAVGVSIYPFFSDLAAKGDREGLTDTLMGAMRLIAFIFIPLSVALILLRFPILRLAFERGKFSADSVALTAGPFAYYALGLTSFAWEIILMQFYFSLKDTRTPVVAGILALCVHVTVILCFRAVLLHKSITLAASVSKTAKVLIMCLLLRRKIADLRMRQNVVFLLKTGIAAGLMAIGILFAQHLGTPARFSGDGILARLLSAAWSIGAAALLGGAAYVAASLLLRIEECRTLLRGLQRKPGGSHA